MAHPELTLMLKTLDLGRIFDAAKNQGFSQCILYAEQTAQTHLTGSARLESHALQRGDGLMLQLVNEERKRLLTTSSISTAACLQLIETGMSAETESLPNTLAFDTESQQGLVMALARDLWNAEEKVREPRLDYNAKRRQFCIARSDGFTQEGQDESVSLCVAWDVCTKQGADLWEFSHSGHRVEPLLNTLKTQQRLKAQIEMSTLSLAHWPMPSGSLPVHWSSEVVAKLVSLFLKAFEGENVLEGRTFLRDMQGPLPFFFRIVENPPFSCDGEGTPTKAREIFSEGRPRSIAVDGDLARKLQMKPSGHCRRLDYLLPTSVGFWSAELQGYDEALTEDRFPAWGISVSAIRPENYNPATGDLTLTLSRARLIHQSEVGEFVSPLTFQTNLLALLRSWRWFGKCSQTYGHLSSAHHVTEVAAPDAISEKFPIPGEVSPQHYW